MPAAAAAPGMMDAPALTRIIEEAPSRPLSASLEEMLNRYAVQLEARLLNHEVEEYRRQECADRKTEDGNAAAVRNGYHREREFLTGYGPLPVRVPRLRAPDGKPLSCYSALVPRYVRRSGRIKEALPYLYLKGLAQGEIGPALAGLYGEEALRNVSPAVTDRLKEEWVREYREWCRSDLGAEDWLYVWADTVYLSVWGEGENKQCFLAMIGCNARGEKRLLVLETASSEHSENWEVLLDGLRVRDLRDPRLAIADGAGGFWKVLRKIFPATGYQRCWMHNARNLAAMLPKKHQKKAHVQLRDVWKAMDDDEAKEGAEKFIGPYGRKYPEIAESLRKDLPLLLTFFDFSAEHRRSIRSTNAIESMFSGVEHRARQSRGCLSPESATGMTCKIGRDSEKRRRCLSGHRRLADVLEFKPFKNGLPVQPDSAQDALAA